MKAIVLISVMVISSFAYAQRDTLHLNYNHSQTSLGDTSLKKIDKWVAGLKGQKTKIKVHAYYSKADYEKFAQERADELFLILNRKARAVLTIDFIGPKRGKTWQRSMVDIIYDAPSSTDETAAAGKSESAAPAKEEPVAKKSEEKAKEPEPVQKHEEKSQAPAESKPLTGSDVPAVDLSGLTGASDEEFSSKTLYVALLSETGPGTEKPDYKSFVRYYNELVTKTFNERWKYSQLKVVPESEAAAGQDGSGIVLTMRKRVSGSPGVMTMHIKSASYEKEFTVPLAGAQPAVSDIVMIQHKILSLYSIRREFDRSQLRPALAGRKLYIGTDQLDMPAAQVGQTYLYPFAVVSPEERNKMAEDAVPGAMYLQPEKSSLVIVDAATGVVLARTEASKSKVKASALKELTDDKKQLTEIRPLTLY
jgi:hypothetical protein